MKNILLFTITISISIFLCCCANQQIDTNKTNPTDELTKYPPNEWQELPFHTSNNRKDGKSFSIVLKTNPSTGFDWIIDYEGEGKLENYKTEQSTPPVGLAGAGYERAYFFKPTKAGNCKITFTYKRSWENVEPATVLSYTFEIDESSNVKYTDSESTKNDAILKFYNEIE